MPGSTADRNARGRGASSPWAVPPRGWKDVLLRSWREAGTDNISLIASGVAFCAILALVPMLGAVVLSYGLFATPQTVVDNVRTLMEVMPTDAAQLIGEQLANLVTSSDGKKGFGLLIALAIALYGAMKGATAVITALNIAYDEEESRGFVALNLLALGITAGAVVLAVLAIVSITALGALQSLFPDLPTVLVVLGKILSYAIMTGVAAAAAATLYRFGPDRDHARWIWLTPGSLLAALIWLLVTLGFGFYVANFGSYNATYGSLGAAVVLLTWLYLSAYILLLGAELNCELERQTAEDTTTGAARPMGDRNAYAADTVASGSAAVHPGPKQAEPAGPVREAARGYALTRVVPARSGLVPTLLVTGGLALLRRRGRAGAGAALLAAGGTISFLRRR